MLEAIQNYSWPGNIRELQNVIERWAIVSESDDRSMSSWVPCEEPSPGTSDEPPVPNGEAPCDGRINLREYLEAIERSLIGRTMTAVGGNQSEAARRLGLSRGSLLERLKKYVPS